MGSWWLVQAFVKANHVKNVRLEGIVPVCFVFTLALGLVGYWLKSKIKRLLSQDSE